MYSTSTIWLIAISPDARIVVQPSFLIVFAPSPFTLSVAVPVFARFALNVNFCPATYAVGAGVRVIAKVFTAPVAAAYTQVCF